MQSSMKIGQPIPSRLVGRLRRVAWLLAWVFLPCINQGADGADDTKMARVRSEHWSLQTLKEPAVPLISTAGSKVSDSSRPIDAFIIARLAANGLALSPEADRATLIRRLSFDLIGLPP